jgi:hypothetical protein
MPELELTRTPGDKKLYVLEGAGTLRLRGWTGRSATAETPAGDRSWELVHRGLFRTVLEASDAAGTPIGAYEPRTFRRGGALTWQGRDYGLRAASAWKQRYALTDGDRELATIEGKGWGKRPVRVSIDDPSALPPGLLLFAAYVVRALAEDAQSAAAGGAAAASTAATSG